jgi:hypothetical protein
VARGGSRQGKPGQAYGQRSDLQAAKAPTGLEYGQHKQLIDAQHAVALPQAGTAPAPTGPPSPPPGGAPVVLGAFDRPTEQPNVPVTAGLPVGPGPGPEALQTVGPAADNVGQQLRALYAQNPNNDLLRLIELHDNGY